MDHAAIICAAGKGRRMGLGMNKQFLDLNGKPLFIHTLHAWQQVDSISEIVFVCGQGEAERVRQEMEVHGVTCVSQVVEGGAERQDSVYTGLMALAHREHPPCYVSIHDGARPFVQATHIKQMVQEVKKHPALIMAVPVSDTIKQVDEHGVVQHTPNRSQLWAVQTPQTFEYTLIRRAHEQARECGYVGTDDASLVERIGENVRIVEGSPRNMKITTPADIQMALYMLESDTAINNDDK